MRVKSLTKCCHHRPQIVFFLYFPEANINISKDVEIFKIPTLNITFLNRLICLNRGEPRLRVGHLNQIRTWKLSMFLIYAIFFKFNILFYSY